MRRLSCSFRGMLSNSPARPGSCSLPAVFVALATIAALALAPRMAHASGIEGVWIDDTGKGAVEIHHCGPSICGRIVWLRNPNDRAGRPLTDSLNPSVRRRHRPICGLQVIGKAAAQPNGTWDSGWIYDPKTGRAYDVMLKLKSDRKLIVTGYMGVKFLSESFVWRRAPNNLKRCDM